MEILLSNTFYPLLEDQHRYLVLCGGRGSGKSEFAARKVFYRAQVEGDHRFLILRKVRKTCGVSVIKVFQRLLSENAIDYTYNKSDHIIMWQAPNGTANELLFDGLDEPEKIKSIKGITSMWIEETTEFTEKEFVEVDLCLREPGPLYKQIIMSFNPDEALAPWLKKRFFDNIDPNAFVHPSTVLDNPIASMRQEYLNDLERLTDPTRRDVWLYGKWGALRGQIYKWDVQAPPIHVDEIWYGGDFGYSVSDAALIKIYRKSDEYWLEELIYEKGLTNQDIGERMILTKEGTNVLGINPKLPSYWDSAEMKSIEELYRLGINALPALKGPDSVRSGIDFLKCQKIHVVPGSTNIIREAGRYNWREDKNGNPLPEPVKFDDHAMDATRYGIVTHMRGGQEAGFFMTKHSVYI